MLQMQAEGRDEPAVSIVYDGDCPFCSAYIRMIRLRASIGRVELFNAREGGPVVEDFRAKGIDLDHGMVLKLGDRIYHGDECIHRLALLSTPSGVLNRLNAVIFRSPRASRALYPILRAGRNATLFLMGRRKLAASAPRTP